MPAKQIHYFVLNGPPKSGKSTIARILCKDLQTRDLSVVTDSFAAPMKHFIATALGMQYHDMPKDSPRAELAGYSVREFLIDLSENYIKPRYGNDAYGRWLAHRIGRMSPAPDCVICDDSGFQDEADALGHKAHIIRVIRPNCDYSNDSRSYLPDPWFVLGNGKGMPELQNNIAFLATAIETKIKGY